MFFILLFFIYYGVWTVSDEKYMAILLLTNCTFVVSKQLPGEKK